MTTGEKIQKARKAHGLTQEELATRLKVSRQAISRWELNEVLPETDNVIQLCKTLNISTDFLLDGDAQGERRLTGTSDTAKEEKTKSKIISNILCGCFLIFAFISVLLRSYSFFMISTFWLGVAYLVYLLVSFLKKH